MYGPGAGGGGFGIGLGGALLGGQLLSSVGSFFGAQSANRNARRYQDEQAQNQAINNNRRGYSYFGMNPTEDFMASGNYTAGTPATRGAASDRFNASIGGPIMGQYNQLASDAAQGGGDISRGYYGDTARLRQLGQGNIADLGRAYAGGISNTLGGYDTGARDLTTRIDEYGRGQESRIRRDAGRDLQSTNDQTRAALAAAGLGKSTAIGNQLASNSRRSSEYVGDALSRLGDSQIDRSVGLRRGLLSERTGLVADAQQRSNDALERGLNTNLSNEYARSTGQTQLDENALNRNLGIRGNNLGLLTNQINGLTQPGSQQYIPQYSLAGTALSGAGQGLGSLATLLAMQNIYRRNG